MPFNHEKLRVYQRTLTLNAKVGGWTARWDSRHALCDQFARAAGSVLENIATSSASWSAMKQRYLEYAVGSTCECAACLDLARVKALLDEQTVVLEKRELSQVMCMLVALRRSSLRPGRAVREEGADYDVEAGFEPVDGANDWLHATQPLFHHESLDIYRVALSAATAFCSSARACSLPNTVFRRLDESFTGILLNIAEGNGRFSDADQRRFLGTAREAAVKLAAKSDVCVAQKLLSRDDVEAWKPLLERIAAMTMATAKKLVISNEGRQCSGQSYGNPK